jgi:hypothetical protein
MRIFIALSLFTVFNGYTFFRIFCRWPWAKQNPSIAWILATLFFALQLMRNPEYTGHLIRKLLDTQSGFHWTLNPEMTGQ